jgi:outer membrane receptor protein involved in Fe transport
VRVLGVEVEVRRGFGVSHSLFANYAYQDAEARNGTGRAAEVPAHLANFGVSLLFRERYGLTSTLQLRSERPRAPFDLRRPTDGSAVLGVSGRVDDLANVRGLGVDVLVDDVFDQEVFDPAPLVPGDYPRPGRRFLAHLSYRF